MTSSKGVSLLPPGLLSEGYSPWSVDSLYFSIPLEQCQILNPELLAKIEVMEVDKDTGEVYHTREKLSSNRVQVGEEHTGNYRNYSILTTKSGSHRVLKVWLSSKSLGSGYFSGITSETLPFIYQTILNDAQVIFPFEALLLSRVTDIDLKRDFLFTGVLEDMVDYYLHLQGVYNRTHHKRRGIHVHKEIGSLNVGLDLNERIHTRTLASTFLKAYYKGGLLLTKDNLFRQTYLLDIEEDILRRIHRQEFTISGKHHLKVLGMGSVETLDELLHTTQERISEAFFKVMQVNFTREPIRMKTKDSKNTGRQNIIKGLLEAHLQSGYTIESFSRASTRYLEVKQRRDEVRKDIVLMHEELIASGTLDNLPETPERSRSRRTSLDLLIDLFSI